MWPLHRLLHSGLRQVQELRRQTQVWRTRRDAARATLPEAPCTRAARGPRAERSSRGSRCRVAELPSCRSCRAGAQGAQSARRRAGRASGVAGESQTRRARPSRTTGHRKLACCKRECQNVCALPAGASYSKASTPSAKPAAPPVRQLPPLADQAEVHAPCIRKDILAVVEWCLRQQDADPSTAASAAADERTPPAKRPWLVRCGTCVGCRFGDCGECESCKDKPKNGGRGIMKQACLHRECISPIDTSLDGDRLTNGGFLSSEPSPALRPSFADGSAIEPVPPSSIAPEPPSSPASRMPTTMALWPAPAEEENDEIRASEFGATASAR